MTPQSQTSDSKALRMNDAKALLRHFSVTDGLIRGTGLLSMVVFNAAIALLPGFGIYGLIISNALQDLINGIFEIPLGWLSDRFGWSKAVILAMGLKILVPIVDLLAVYSAWIGAHDAIWIFISLDSLIDAFVFSLQNGAYQAAYTEWYQTHLAKRGWNPEEEAPPLFIQSQRYAMWIRLFVPLSVLLVLISMPLAPIGQSGLTAYTATFLSFGVILILRIAVFFRVVSDLGSLHLVERSRIERRSQAHWKETFRDVLTSITENKPAFVLYALACFQTILSGGLITGLGMRQLNELSWPEPYGWLAGIGLALAVYVMDALFWVFFGHRIRKENVAIWIRNLGIQLLGICVITATLHLLEAHHLLQGLSFGVCVLFGAITAGAITRFISSHLREWIHSDLIATWMSVANCVSLIGISAMGWAIIKLDPYIPIVFSLLLVSVLIAFGIIYYLSHGILEARREAISLRAMLARSSLSVAILAGVIVGAVTLLFSVTRLVLAEKATEREYLEQLSQTPLKSQALQEVGWLNLTRAGEICLLEELPALKPFWSACGEKPVLAASNHVVSVRVDDKLYEATLRFDRSHLLTQVVQYFLLAAVLFLIAVAVFYQLLIALTRRVHHELETILRYSTTPVRERNNKVLNQFLVLEFKEITEKLEALNHLRNELTKHRTVADISARVAHDIRSPLSVFKILSKSFETLPESSRALLQGAVQRMCEISSELLQAEKKVRESEALVTASEQPHQGETLCFLPQILPEILHEKKTVAEVRGEIAIEIFYDHSAYSSFVVANPSLLKSIVANLIQNSIDAIDGEGEIEIMVKCDGNRVFLEVADDGCGIPEEILPLLLREKKTFGKENGNGLGLFFARRTIEDWGGSIQLHSKVGMGTHVTLQLRKALAPKWFLPQIEMTPQSHFCLLEEDPAIQEVWRRKLSFLKQSAPNLSSHFFSGLSDFAQWQEAMPRPSRGIALIAHELTKTNDESFALVKRLRQSFSDFEFILVSQDAQDSLQRECEAMGIKLLPKHLAPAIPLVVKS